MSRRGTTAVAWLIGLSALAAQAVIGPIVNPKVEVTAPAPPTAPKAEPATDVLVMRKW